MTTTPPMILPINPALDPGVTLSEVSLGRDGTVSVSVDGITIPVPETDGTYVEVGLNCDIQVSDLMLWIMVTLLKVVL